MNLVGLRRDVGRSQEDTRAVLLQPAGLVEAYDPQLAALRFRCGVVPLTNADGAVLADRDVAIFGLKVMGPDSPST